jgi:hypothetical protein
MRTIELHEGPAGWWLSWDSGAIAIAREIGLPLLRSLNEAAVCLPNTLMDDYEAQATAAGVTLVRG